MVAHDGTLPDDLLDAITSGINQVVAAVWPSPTLAASAGAIAIAWFIGAYSIAFGVLLVSLATPLVSESVRDKWFSFPDTLWLMLLPAASLAAGHALAPALESIAREGTGPVAVRRGASWLTNPNLREPDNWPGYQIVCGRQSKRCLIRCMS